MQPCHTAEHPSPQHPAGHAQTHVGVDGHGDVPSDAMHHTMAGLPSWSLVAAVGAAALVSGLGMWRDRVPASNPRPAPRFELTALRPVRWLVGKRWFQFAVQLPLVVLLGIILWAGFNGSPVADRNAATVLTWTLWWTLLIVDIVLLGRTWCLVCPWDALASWLRRLAFWRRRDEPLSLELRWPRWLRNVYPATVLFVGLTWLELGYGVTLNPRATAILGLTMVVLAVIPALIFERKSFCKYGCLIGRICGLYSMTAPVELRARDLDVCKACKTKDCYTGNDKGYPCPTGQCLPSMTSNTYCTLCTECIKSCPSDNVAINLRPWSDDLDTQKKPRRDEAILALVMLSLTSFHGLTMTPTWTELLRQFRALTGLAHLPAFTVGMLAILVVPALLYLAVSYAAAKLGGPNRSLLRRQSATWSVASAYAYPLIAVALMYHLAHNAGHLLSEAGAIVPVISDPLGRGDDFFGTAAVHPGPLASQAFIWALAVGLVLLGHGWATRAMRRSHHHVAKARKQPKLPLKTRIVMTTFILAATCANLWLLAQPMEMRTGM